jgi:trk system potassium uptake protein TrkA
MKYIIIGLGNFGTTLCTSLTAMGHEVIGVDKDMQKVNQLKDRITHGICLDSSDINAVTTLPLKDADIVIVCIGEDIGASVLTTAILKQNKVKKLISRASSDINRTVIEAIGVDMIISPEKESAERFAKKLQIEGVVDSFELSEHYSIIEARVPARYVGRTIEEINFRGRYNLNVLTIIKMREKTNLIGRPYKMPEVLGVIGPKTQLEENDILVLFGRPADVQSCISPRK